MILQRQFDMTSTSVRPVKDAEFEQLVSTTSKVVMIDFGAPWCGPCRQMEPLLEEVAAEFSEHLLVGAMNVDEDPENATRLGVRGLPTFLILKNGVEVGRQTGTMTKTELVALLKSHFD